MSTEDLKRYEFVRTHYRGDIGSITVMRDTVIGREVALKTIHPDGPLQERIRSLFIQEARTTGQLEHPNIVPVYDLGSQQGDDPPYYTMRYVRGETLFEHIHRFHAKRHHGKDTPIDLHQLINALTAVGQAISFAHSKGVLHLDLKPSNIMLGEFGEVIVLDWGNDDRYHSTPPAHGSTAPDQSSRIVIGTPIYMAPEQYSGSAHLITPATDVYGLGGILHEILTGSPPHPLKEGSSTDHEARTIDDSDLPPREEVLRILRETHWAPKGLVAICTRALENSPYDRYEKASEFIDDLQCWMADQPVSVYSPPVTERCSRWIRKNKPLSVAAVAILLVSLVFLTNLFHSVLVEKEDQLANALNLEIQFSQEPLRAIRQYMLTEGGISRDQFREFTAPYLEHHKELQAIEWIPRVPADQRADYEQRALGADVRTIKFTERSDQGTMVQAGHRDIYYPVWYVEPLTGNRKALGYDLGSSDLRLEALNTAWEKGDITVTPPIELVQASNKEKGVLVFAPLFANEFTGSGHPQPEEGFVLGVCRIKTLLEDAWKGLDLKYLITEVYDVTDPDTPVFLWRNLPGDPQLEYAALAVDQSGFGLRTTSRKLKLWNRTWVICIRAQGRFLLHYQTSS